MSAGRDVREPRLVNWVGDRRTLAFLREVTDRNEGDCWLWPGTLDKGGYANGRFGRQRKEKAHRVAWSIANGAEIPDGMTVDHMCFTTSCVNPDHLRLLSNSENARRQRRSLADTCARGHLWTPENTGRQSMGRGRYCRQCQFIRKAGFTRKQPPVHVTPKPLPALATGSRDYQRRWAISHGMRVALVGALPKNVLQAYEAAIVR